VTGRLRRHVAKAVGDGAAVSVACAGLMSWPIAHDAWVVHADALLAEPEQVAVLGSRRDPPRTAYVGAGRDHRQVEVDRAGRDQLRRPRRPQGLLV